jgi:hypothetical protein
MLKRIGVFVLMLASGAAILPTAALAQDGYYYPRDNYLYQRDRDWDRREARRWRQHEWRERRAEERREHEWRERRWREHERSERRFDRDYSPNGYLYFGYGR